MNTHVSLYAGQARAATLVDFVSSDMEGIVYEAIGAASMCWANIHDAGVFDSQRARDIGDALLEKVRNYAVTGDPNRPHPHPAPGWVGQPPDKPAHREGRRR